ncbi:MAG: IS3 family transposase, partial [Clostridia bacterium]|nr:IS3 family transposase [Clostridia bacterium]
MRTSVKFMVIYRHKDKYSISEMCRFFDVSRSGYYDYVKRIDTPAKDLPLAKKIKECQEKHGKTYGYRRVHIWLERQGIHHNPKTVLRVMQKYNLLSEVRRKKYRNYGNVLHKYDNLLDRDFSADRPNQKWVTDISYIKTGQGTLYLSVIRDLYDNSIVAYKTGTEQNINLVLSTIRAAKRKEKVTAEVQLHSDQGFQYTSQAYFNLTKSYGIIPSMSRRGNPYDNAMAENFF